MMNFGVIVLYKADVKLVKELCDLGERDLWFSDYLIFNGANCWISVHDENLEWGNIDIYVKHVFNQIKATLLSVEFYDDRVRYKLWKNGYCFAEKIIEQDDAIFNNDEVVNEIFAKELKITSQLMSKIFAVKRAVDSVMIMESVLQCQLWKCEERVNGDKVIDTKYCFPKYLDEYFKHQTNAKILQYVVNNERFLIKKPVQIKGVWGGIYSGIPVVLDEEEGKGIFYSVDKDGKLYEELCVSNELTYYSLTKFFIGNGRIGFLTEKGFALYEQNHLISVFSDIWRSIESEWHAYMSDDDTIYMDWACYDVKSGKRKWGFPLPAEKSYNHFLQREMWHELPNGRFVNAVNADQETLYLSLFDKFGQIQKTISEKISYAYHRVDISKQYICLVKCSEVASSLLEVTVYDFNLKQVGNYCIESNFTDYSIYFDSHGKYLYTVSENRAFQIHIESDKMYEYFIPIKQGVCTWGMLPNDFLFIVIIM